MYNPNHNSKCGQMGDDAVNWLVKKVEGKMKVSSPGLITFHRSDISREKRKSCTIFYYNKGIHLTHNLSVCYCNYKDGSEPVHRDITTYDELRSVAKEIKEFFNN